MKFLPYKMGSRSAKELRKGFTKALLKRPDTPVKKRNEVIINWGHSNPRFDTSLVTIINQPTAVKLASNKLTAFKRFAEAGVNTVKFTTSYDEAVQWINDGFRVFARFILNGSSGRGIVVAENVESLPRNAPLYTRYFKKKKEFRVHIFNGEIIDYAEKRARLDKGPTFSPYIRSHDHGWIFARDGITEIQSVKDEALKAVAALGLDFGAVDVVWSDRKTLVLEVNTAPGLTGTTLTRYIEAIKKNGYHLR